MAMADGRGEYQNLLEGLEKTTIQQPQCRSRRRKQRGRRGRESLCHSNPGPKREHEKLQKRSGKHSENCFERLPPEILMKILSYLDASSLFLMSHVNKQFFHLANDGVLWHKIYVSEFGMTRPSWPKLPEVKQEEAEDSESSASHWKQRYFNALAGQEVNKWTHVLKAVNPNTGLPVQMEWVLRKLMVNWQLRVQDCFGKEFLLTQNKVSYCETSLVVRWNSSIGSRYKNISSIQLQGVREDMLRSLKKKKLDASVFDSPVLLLLPTFPPLSPLCRPSPYWYSQMLNLDMLTQKPRLLGKDRLIKLLFLSPGFIVGIWRGEDLIAFVMVCLHYHGLIERTLLGSPMSPYRERMVRPSLDKSKLEEWPHGYNLHFGLNNACDEFVSVYFPEISPVHTEEDHMMFNVLSKNNLSKHWLLPGNTRLLWRTEALEGSVENCCVMTLTLVDQLRNPFWCVSAPISIRRAKKPVSLDYGGEHFLIEHHTPEGQVKIKLVWLREKRQFMLISLIIFVPIFKVNE